MIVVMLSGTVCMVLFMTFRPSGNRPVSAMLRPPEISFSELTNRARDVPRTALTIDVNDKITS